MKKSLVFLILACIVFVALGFFYLNSKKSTEGSLIQTSSANNTPKEQDKIPASIENKEAIKAKDVNFPSHTLGEIASLEKLPAEIIGLFTSEEMKLDKLQTASFSDGSKGYIWRGSIEKELNDAYRGWRSRLRDEWLMLEASRGEVDAVADYYNQNSRIKVVLESKEGQTLQTVYIIVK